MESPYAGHPVEDWEGVTRQLIDVHPLDANEIYNDYRPTSAPKPRSRTA